MRVQAVTRLKKLRRLVRLRAEEAGGCEEAGGVPRVPGPPASTGAGAHVLGRTRPFKGHWCDQHPYSALQRPPFPDMARMVNAYRKAGRAVAGKITGDASRPIAPFISS
ncbi:hypothetical protein DIPPA_32315 [Diplonema papillatum]|nr:hypothetical protein DIPPA_32315 [Diplonema papillatum]